MTEQSGEIAGRQVEGDDISEMADYAIDAYDYSFLDEGDETAPNGDWLIEEGVRCVVAPCCAFTFDADHTDNRFEDGYSCPSCEVDRLREAHDALYDWVGCVISPTAERRARSGVAWDRYAAAISAIAEANEAADIGSSDHPNKEPQ